MEKKRFIRDDDDEDDDYDEDDGLFKEYAIIDLSRYRTGEIGLRWRTELEVVSGKGQKTCANRKCLVSNTQLKSYEVPFNYTEHNHDKSALVKVVLCYECSKLLHHYNTVKKKRLLKEQAKLAKLNKSLNKRKRRDDDDGDGDGDDGDDVDDGDGQEAEQVVNQDLA
ncbi:hypothetical protein SAMD00019534_060390 [Acytostelium subglobosum LB1]|uniref:hypothetical protein n=1 Tax=Acytostelium subglobosum LB1 TaxID=1410327 RepID=UPI0006449198|nr:hypothetical protein SAMD00019534_060390 [Acytostelium subglobosum LB1]GAM22864.1 hypothetical protein SAMD00019534_060390 [Acytostelium subglobosum LB1]|eukprot:XP_012754091.1 hypothetical protein SAMD00019534_060390 [Acytostelium subglobosum LB1]